MLPYTTFSLLTWGLLLLSFNSAWPTRVSGAFIFASFFFYNMGFLAFFFTKGVLCLAFLAAASPPTPANGPKTGTRYIIAALALFTVVVVTVTLQAISLVYLKQSEFVLEPPLEAVERYSYFQNVYFFCCAAISSLAAIVLGIAAFRVYRSVGSLLDLSFSSEGNQFVRSLGLITVACICSFLARGATALGFAYQVNSHGLHRFAHENSAFIWFEPLNVVVSDMLPSWAILWVLRLQVLQGLRRADTSLRQGLLVTPGAPGTRAPSTRG